MSTLERFQKILSETEKREVSEIETAEFLLLYEEFLDETDQ